MAHVSVNINGRAYRMACDDGQEPHLMGLGERLDRRIGDMRESFGEIGDMRLTVMAAIMTTDDLSEAERRIAALEAELRSLADARASILARIEAAQTTIAGTINETAERIERLGRQLADEFEG